MRPTACAGVTLGVGLPLGVGRSIRGSFPLGNSGGMIGAIRTGCIFRQPTGQDRR